MVFTLHRLSKTIIMLSVLMGMILIPGCARKAQRERASYRYDHKQDNVHVSVEMMSANQAKNEFGVNLFDYGFVPLVLTVNNQTSDALLLRGQSVHVPLANPYDVAASTHYPTALLTTYSAYLSAIFFWPALLPSLGGGYYMSQANAAITQSVCARGLSSDASVDVLPYEQISRVLFVPANAFSSSFRMHVFDVHAKSFIPFTVNLGVAIKDTNADDLLEHAVLSS